jgi:hypothetical protein
MPFTAAQVINDALVLNRKTQERAMITTDSAEVIEALNRSLQGIYQAGARINPAYYGTVATVAESPLGQWARPSNAELVVLIRNEAGDTIYPSTPEEPIPDPDTPSVVRWGRVYRRPAGAALPSGPLIFWYSRRPTPIAFRTDTVDLEDTFRALLVYDLGMWLAHRDQRWDEVGLLTASLERYLQLYVTSLEHESVGDVRNVGQLGTFDSPSLTDLKALLLSGSIRP